MHTSFDITMSQNSWDMRVTEMLITKGTKIFHLVSHGDPQEVQLLMLPSITVSLILLASPLFMLSSLLACHILLRRTG